MQSVCMSMYPTFSISTMVMVNVGIRPTANEITTLLHIYDNHTDITKLEPGGVTAGIDFHVFFYC